MKFNLRLICSVMIGIDFDSVVSVFANLTKRLYLQHRLVKREIFPVFWRIGYMVIAIILFRPIGTWWVMW